MIAISGIRIDSLSITRKDDEIELTGSYSLISTADKVLAKQSFNGYNEIKVVLTADGIKARDGFIKQLKLELSTVLGLESESI